METYYSINEARSSKCVKCMIGMILFLIFFIGLLMGNSVMIQNCNCTCTKFKV